MGLVGRHVISELDERLALANRVYDALGFQRSVPRRDRTYGVVADESVVALGRIQRWANGVVEVGGFWTREDHRGRGIAREMIAHVLDTIPTGHSVWCVALDHLVPLYESFGMQRVGPGEEVPPAIVAKLDSCRSVTLDGRRVGATLLRWR